VTARTADRAAAIDHQFTELAEWIDQGRAPISPGLAAYLLPKLATGKAGTLQFEQGQAASAFAKQNIDTRLTRPDGSRRNLFLRVTDTLFDTNGRLLAYVAPNYSPRERETLSRAQRATFNLDLLTHGWAAPFVLYPSIPGELDLPLLVAAAATARTDKKGIWSDSARRCWPTSTGRWRSCTPSRRGSSPVKSCGVRPPSGGENATAPTCGTECCTAPRTT
jgi:endonuclease YncB( thermonuclease family)